MEIEKFTEKLQVRISPTMKNNLHSKAYYLGVRPSDIVRIAIARELDNQFIDNMANKEALLK